MSKTTRPQQLNPTALQVANGPTSHRQGTKPVPPPVYRPQPTPKVLQRKAAPAPQAQAAVATKRAPVAPPVYRPQPGVLQAKTAAPRVPPVAPPVYRPQPTPKVLQRKTAASQTSHNVGRVGVGTHVTSPRPAPPALKPGPGASMLPRKASTARGVPHAQKLPAAPNVLQRSKSVLAPPVRPRPGTSNVLQMLHDSWNKSVTAGSETLPINPNKDFILYSNDADLKSCKAGSLHFSIHIDPDSDRNQWDASAYTLSGKLYVSKRTYVCAQIVDGNAVETGNYDSSNEEEKNAMETLKASLQEVYTQLRPYQWASKDSHMYRTTMHNGSISLN